MRVITTLSVLFVILLASCQKEIDWGLNTTTPDKLLVKLFQKTGSDSTTIVFTYNTAKQLIEEKTTGVSGANNLDNDFKIYRTASGIIDRTVQVAAALSQAGIDSVVTKYNYNSATSKYTSAVFSINLGGFNVTDSTVFTYDASGKITMDEHYQSMAGFPAAILSLKNQYTYSADGLSLLSIQQSAPSTLGGPLSPVATQTFTYDTKKSPLILKNEAILLTRTGYFSNQNATKATLSNTIDPTADFNLDITYRYNTANTPDSSFSRRTPGGGVTASKYFYQ